MLLRLLVSGQHIDGIFDLHSAQCIESAPNFDAKPLKSGRNRKREEESFCVIHISIFAIDISLSMTKCQTLPDKMNSISVKQILFMYFWVVKMSFIAHKKYIILVKRRKIVSKTPLSTS